MCMKRRRASHNPFEVSSLERSMLLDAFVDAIDELSLLPRDMDEDTRNDRRYLRSKEHRALHKGQP